MIFNCLIGYYRHVNMQFEFNYSKGLNDQYYDVSIS